MAIRADRFCSGEWTRGVNGVDGKNNRLQLRAGGGEYTCCRGFRLNGNMARGKWVQRTMLKLFSKILVKRTDRNENQTAPPNRTVRRRWLRRRRLRRCLRIHHVHMRTHLYTRRHVAGSLGTTLCPRSKYVRVAARRRPFFFSFQSSPFAPSTVIPLGSTVPPRYHPPLSLSTRTVQDDPLSFAL